MKVTPVAALMCAVSLHAETEFHDPIVLESPNVRAQGYFGAGEIASLPDVNHDGIADFAIGAIGDTTGGSPHEAGRVYIFSGATRRLLRELKSPGEVSQSSFGSKVKGIGDLNRNGTGDVIVATGSAEKRIYTFDGGSGRLIHTIHARGRSISAVSDVTGDGVPDIARGEFRTAIVYDGATGNPWKTLVNPDSGGTNLYGWSLAGVPDVNGDGKGEVVVSDWQAGGDTGRVHLFDGATGRHLRNLSPVRDRPGDQLGRSVAGLADVNGDGRGDVLVGASGGNRAYVFDGSTGEVIHQFRSRSSPATPNFGWVVAALPDVTGDDVNDVAVGGFPAFGDTLVATVSVFDGVTGRHVYDLPGQSDWGGGGSVAGVPDLNGDGLGEVLLAHSHATSSGGQSEAGHVKLFLSAAREDTRPLVTAEGNTVTVSWKAGVYDRLQFSTNGTSWENLPGVDARALDSFSEARGVRGPLTLYRLSRD